jgi:hypothetical protein
VNIEEDERFSCEDSSKERVQIARLQLVRILFDSCDVAFDDGPPQIGIVQAKLLSDLFVQTVIQQNQLGPRSVQVGTNQQVALSEETENESKSVIRDLRQQKNTGGEEKEPG